MNCFPILSFKIILLYNYACTSFGLNGYIVLHGFGQWLCFDDVPPTKLALQHSSLDFMVLFFVSPRKETSRGESDMTTSDEAHPQCGGVKVSLLVG